MNGATLLDRALDAAVVPAYSRVGYALRRLAWAGAPEGHLDGRTVLVTGGSSGLGRAAWLWDECDRLSMRFVPHSAISSC